MVGVRMEWRKAARWGRRRGQGCSRGLARVVAAYWSGVVSFWWGWLKRFRGLLELLGRKERGSWDSQGASTY